MTLSVAMATFNGGRHLPAQLDSIRRQTLPPTELVVSDDGSTDDTVEILRRFAADAPFPVHVDAHGQRLGFTPNFLRAIGRCTGDLVALCDQDDVWDERKLAVCAPPFAADASIMTVTHRIQLVDDDLKPAAMVMPPANLRGRYTFADIEPWFSPNGMQMLFRRAPIAPWLATPPALSLYEWFVTEPFDEWIFHTGLLLGMALILEEVLGVWRRHGATVTNNLEQLAQSETAAHRLQFALQSGTAPYEFRARLADSRAEYAARTVAHPDGTPATSLPGAADHFRRMAHTFRRRVRLHDPATARLPRLRTFLSMALQNDYRSQNRGGIGAKAALKDAYTVVLGTRV